MKPKRLLLLLLAILLIASLACSLAGGASDAAQLPEGPAEQGEGQTEKVEDVDDAGEAGETGDAAGDVQEKAAETSQEYDTDFPLPDDVQNFTGGGDQVNFATGMTIEQSIDFYRRIFAEMGLTERKINTAISETTFSMVFDGHAKGQAIVIQGVDLGNGTTNVNIRFEDV